MGELAVLLNTSDTQLTVHLIDYVVENIIEHEFHYYPKGVSRTWRERNGDCTDKAMIKQYMLFKLDIPTRLIHGYDYYGEKHDWYEYKYNGTWWNSEPWSEKIGRGVW
jgi:transglutaminase-like putative cysteine protease